MKFNWESKSAGKPNVKNKDGLYINADLGDKKANLARLEKVFSQPGVKNIINQLDYWKVNNEAEIPSLHKNELAVIAEYKYPAAAGLKAANWVNGGLTPEHGLFATGGSMEYEKGSLRVVVHGDPKTGKPMSWRTFRWDKTGERMPVHGANKYGWVPIGTGEFAYMYDQQKQNQKKNTTKVKR